jgi:hypothetical protein
MAWTVKSYRDVLSANLSPLSNKEHRNSLEFPFVCLALAICDENDRNEGCYAFKGREKVPVLGEVGNFPFGVLMATILSYAMR